MTTVPVRCPEDGCTAVAHIDKRTYDYSVDTELVGLRCPNGHTFDFQKGRCPRCGSAMTSWEWRPPRDWSGKTLPEMTPVFQPDTCTNATCTYRWATEP